MQKTLDNLKNSINENGVVENFEQGSQHFLRENPALKSYNTTIKNYSSLYKQLNDLIPQKEVKPTDDGFESFVISRDD